MEGWLAATHCDVLLLRIWGEMGGVSGCQALTDKQSYIILHHSVDSI